MAVRILFPMNADQLVIQPAERYGVSEEAVRVAGEAVQRGGAV
jgi:hypothetical protein